MNVMNGEINRVCVVLSLHTPPFLALLGEFIGEPTSQCEEMMINKVECFEI